MTEFWANWASDAQRRSFENSRKALQKELTASSTMFVVMFVAFNDESDKE
jgi:hypothetical protein